MAGIDGSHSLEIDAPVEIGLPRALALLRKTIKGPAEQKVRELLAHRPVEGLKKRAESA